MDNKHTETDIFHLLRSGEWMNGFDPEIGPALIRCEDLCFRLNQLPPSHQQEREKLIRELIGHIDSNFILHSPFHCDLGINIRIGKNFVANFNLTILDEAEVNIGDNVFIGPNCSLCTITHALQADLRNAGIMCARPISIESNVWLATNVIVLPGVTIGEGSVIGAGSVVTKSIPPHVLAAGNPCRIIRNI